MTKSMGKNKKVKTRIVYSHKGKYTIEYKTGWFWKTLEKFIFIGVDYDVLNCWNPVFEYPEYAEKLAKEISTIEGLNGFYKKQNEIYNKYLTEKKEYLKKIRPFGTKNINE